MPRQPNGQPSIYLGADGWWHTYVTVGRKGDGTLDRRHIRRKTATAVAEGVEELKAKLRLGHVPTLGKKPKVRDWVHHYLTVIAPLRIVGSTLEGYESKCRTWIIPHLGHHQLDKLATDHIEAFKALLNKRVAPATALQIYRILSRMLKVAHKQGKIPFNPCTLVDPPSGKSTFKARPPMGSDVARILAAAEAAGVAARWWVALGLGVRQGEALGLLWDYVDLNEDAPTLEVRWALTELVWRHGCQEPCGRKRGCDCPARRDGGRVLATPKSEKSMRLLALPEVVAKVLREHRKAQRKQRLAVGPRWTRFVGPDGETGGPVFPGPTGDLMTPSADWREFKMLLVAAGVSTVERVHERGRHAGETYTTSTVRTHDARHHTGTLMYLEGHDRQEIMDQLGHSQMSVSARYTHITPAQIRARAARLDAALKLLQPQPATTRPSG